MSKEKINNLEKPTPKGQVGKEADEIKDIDELSHEELKKKVMEESEKTEPKDEPKDEVKDEPKDEPKDEVEEEEEKETWEQKYDNLRKLQSSQTDELGDLRKFRKETEELKEKTKEYQINSTKDHILRQVEEMKPEEREKFYEKFSESPDKALTPLISKILSPFMIIQARHNNEVVISKLRKDTKDSIIPYDKYEDEINETLNKYNKNGRNELFDKFGSGAFEEAYNVVYKKHIKEDQKKEKEEIVEKAKKEAEEDFNKKKNTFTEPQGKSSASKGGKPINYEDMSKEQLDKLVGKPNDD